MANANAVNIPGGGLVKVFEDFTGDNGANLTEQVSGASEDVIAKHGGWFRQTIGANDTDVAFVGGEAAFETDEGSPLVMEIRLLSTDVSVSSIFVGMTDSNGDTVVIEEEDGTLNTIATDAFGFLLEGEQDTTWQKVGVQNDTDNTQAALTSATDAADSVVQVLRLEATPNSSGTVRHYIDGDLVDTSTSWYRSSVVFLPAVSSDARGTAFNTDIDYIYAAAPRS